MRRLKVIAILLLFPLICIGGEQKHAISLGPNCVVAGVLQHYGFRFEALPLDWTINYDFNGLIQAFDEDFSRYLDPFFLKYHEWGVVENTLYSVVMSHFFHAESDEIKSKVNSQSYLEYLPIPAEKVHRRIQRMLKILNGSDPVYFLRLGMISSEKLTYFRDLIAYKYPTLDFTIVICDVLENPYVDLQNVRYFQIVHAGNTWSEQVGHPQWIPILRELKLIP